MNTVYVSTYEELLDAIDSRKDFVIINGVIDVSVQEIICRDPTDHELKESYDSMTKRSRGKGKKIKDWDKRGQ